MAVNKDNNPEEESSPLLPTTTTDEKKTQNQEKNYSNPKMVSEFSSPPSPPSKEHPVPPMSEPHVADTYGWTADGLPITVMGRPMTGRAQWSSGLCSCLGRNDEFCSSDLEVCMLGSVAPCVLYGSNAERLGSYTGGGSFVRPTGGFTKHCLTYAALYLIGNSLLGWNGLAPCLSYRTRTSVRWSFNLEGNGEALARDCGCCGSLMEDHLHREEIEHACDFATHVFCHPCALCQEAREIRRRLPHPGFNAQPVMVMIPPGEQMMGRQ